MNRHFAYIFALLLLSGTLFAQDDFRKAYDNFRTSSIANYKQFHDEANAEFAKAIQEQWERFQINDGEDRPSRPEPSSFTPVPIDTLQSMSIDIEDVPIEEFQECPQSPETGGLLLSREQPVRQADFDFYGTAVEMEIPAEYGTFHPSGISEKDVGNFWRRLSSYDFTSMLTRYRQYRQRLGMNDWASYEWTVALSKVIFPQNINGEQAIFTVFFLNQAGLTSKVARIDNNLSCLFCSMQQIFARKFVEIGTYKYYLAEAFASADAVYTYDVDFARRTQPFDMRISFAPEFGKEAKVVVLHSSTFGTDIRTVVGKGAMSFYERYPQVDVNVYAAASPQRAFSESLISAVEPFLAGKSNVEAVNQLMKFIQKDFNYKTDIEQFGYEKPFFIEENFIFPFNDCEDRAALLAFLVRRLLGLDVLLLDYPNHLNCAICLDGKINGCYVRKGERNFYVCDPTYIGSRVGMSFIPASVRPSRVIQL